MQQRQSCDYVPTPFDKLAVRTILMAVLRQGVSDRYMDFQSVIRTENRQFDRYETAEAAFEEMRRNVPIACVRFISNELPASGGANGLPVYGEAITAQMGYKDVCSAILIWDDYHLHGLSPWLNREGSRNLLGGGALSAVAQAANRFVTTQQTTPGTVYYLMARG